MSRTAISAALLLFLPLTVLPAACRERGNARDVLRSDESARGLDLALQGDTAAATFQDTALSTPPTVEPAPEPPPRRAAAPRRPRPYTPPREYAPPPRPYTPPREYTPPPRPRPRAQPRVRYEPTEPAPRPARAAAPARVAGASSATLATGAQFAVTLNETLGTDRDQPGDGFTATVEQSVLGDDGEVIIPAGATVHGRVTQVSKSDHVGEAAVISLAFESVSFGGRSYPLQATVVDAHPQRVTRNSVRRTAERAAAGAAAGAILSKIFGRSGAKGAILGAATGTAIAMGTADVDAVLQQGSRVVIRTDAPVTVARR